MAAKIQVSGFLGHLLALGDNFSLSLGTASPPGPDNAAELSSQYKS